LGLNSEGIMHRKNFSCSGVSLIEGLIAIMVMFMAGLALLSSIQSIAELNKKDRDITAAINIAQERQEYFLSQAADITGFDALSSWNPLTYYYPENSRQYVYNVKASNLTSDLKKVEVTIFYAAPASQAPDITKTNGGRILKLSQVIASP